MTELELTNKRQAIINNMMDLALDVSAADLDVELVQKHARIKDLKDQLDKLPTFSSLKRSEELEAARKLGQEIGGLVAEAIEEKIRRENPVIGRPRIGKAKSLKVTLPEEDWKHIDSLVTSGRVASYSEYFRSLHDSSLSDFLNVDAYSEIGRV